MPHGRTSTAAAQANAVMRRHPDCSEGRRRLVARSPHGHEQPVRTTDATGRGPQAPRSYGRYLVALYNTQRPHEALALATPAARYRPSGRGFPEKIEPFDYGPGAIVRRVDGDGWLSFRNRPLKVGRAFSYRRVALRPTDQDGCFDVLFCAQKVGALDLPEAAP